MPLQVVPYTLDHIPAVREFNRRLKDRGAGEQSFPEIPHPEWMPGMHLYVAMEDGAVRGGYILRGQQFRASQRDIDADHYRLPLSEGLIDRAYAMLGLRLVRDALGLQPRLYAMGMGGWDKPLPQMLKRLKWRMCEVPFHFKIVNPGRFLRNIRVLRTSPLRRFAMDAAAMSGAGWIGMKALGIARRLPRVAAELAPSFGSWADDVWMRSRSSYALMGVRDAATLNELYPS